MSDGENNQQKSNIEDSKEQPKPSAQDEDVCSEKTAQSTNSSSSTVLNWVVNIQPDASSVSSNGNSGRYNLRSSVRRGTRVVLIPRAVDSATVRASKRKRSRKPRKPSAPKRRKVRSRSVSSTQSSGASTPPTSLQAALERIMSRKRATEKTKKRVKGNRRTNKK